MSAALEDGWADPARLTRESRRAAALLNAARSALAEQLDVEPDEITFTGSQAASLELGLLGLAAGRSRAGRTLVVSAVEHSSLLHAGAWHERAGGRLTTVPVDGTARVDVDAFLGAARSPDVAAAALQAANHEVGTRQPLTTIAPELADARVPLLVDATHEWAWGTPAWSGSVPVLAGDGRAWGGPAGTGLLIVRRGTRWETPYPLGETDPGRGPSGIDIPAIVGAAAALRAVRADAAAQAARLSNLVDMLRARIPAVVGDCEVLGDPLDRLPHVLTFSCLHVDGEALLLALDREGFSVSSGSSCTSDTLTPSHVLVAMGALTSGNIRISLHPGVGSDDVEDFLNLLPRVVALTRAELPGSTDPASPVQHPSQVIDSRGTRCPQPILELARAWPSVPIGGEITILADDPAAETDIAAWCRLRGQELLGITPQDEVSVAYRVRRLT